LALSKKKNVIFLIKTESKTLQNLAEKQREHHDNNPTDEIFIPVRAMRYRTPFHKQHQNNGYYYHLSRKKKR